ncbi:MAG: isopentenyl-diphosphate Delta-isomerase [Corynebacterium sp.]|nr:isopentenyl-diphosphate Delta-isomerase [Corynebacterium sp.]
MTTQHTQQADAPLEEVVLLDFATKAPIGTAPKATVHGTDTPYHLAFSCYLMDGQGRILLTRRALSKATWPGMWTNSFCGHPGPGESFSDTILRRARQELGIPESAIGEIIEVLPEFSYRAVDSLGVCEWEFCPVFIARLKEGPAATDPDSVLAPVPAEVDSWMWVNPADIIHTATHVPGLLSPWMVEQLSHQQLCDFLLQQG